MGESRGEYSTWVAAPCSDVILAVSRATVDSCAPALIFA